MRLPLALIVLAAAMIVAARPSAAAWTDTGTPFVTNTAFTFTYGLLGGGFSTTCSDGRGGMFVAFKQVSSSGQDSVKLQRLDRAGAVVWSAATRGLPVGAAEAVLPGDGFTVAPDGDGGAWVAYYNTFSGTPGLYAQHFDAEGATTIPGTGVRFGDPDAGVGGQPRVAVTPAGELVGMWVGHGGGGSDTVRVQRVSQDGSLDFGAAGVQVGRFTVAGNDMIAWSIMADGEGLVAVWTEETNSTGPERLRANRVSSTGVLQWGALGTTVFEDADFPVLFADAIWDATDGLTVAFLASDNLEGGTDALVTRLTPAGAVNTSWSGGSGARTAVDGTAEAGTHRSLRIVSDAAAGCVVGWVDQRSASVIGPGGVPFRDDIRAQRYSTSGLAQWTPGGVAVDAGENTQEQLTMAPDGAGGAYVGYTSTPGSTTPGSGSEDIAVVHVNASGSALWKRYDNGGTTAGGAGEQRDVSLAPDGGGGVLMAWDGANQLFANHRESAGGLYTPSITVLTPGSQVNEFYAAMQPIPVTWQSDVGGNVKLEYTVGGGAPVTIASSTADDGSQTWFAPVVNSGQVRVRVTSLDEPTVSDESTQPIGICPTVNAAVLVGGTVSVPRDVEIADFDEDGILDLAVAVAGGVSIHRGNGAAGVGNASFQNGVVYATPAAANRVAIGDFDEDGILDLAVTHGSGLTTFRGDGAAGVGDGTFAAGVAVAGIGRAVGVVAADLDDDGVLDLAVADSVNNRVGFFRGETSGLGDGTGSFDAPVFVGSGTQPEGLAAGDLDRDGDVDVISANAAHGSFSVFRNTGRSGFGSGAFLVQDVTTFTGPHAVVAHDFDDDGDLDVAVAHAAGITVHPNVTAAGGILFGAATDYVSLPAADLVVADLGRNGIEDLAIASNIGAMQGYFGDGASSVGDGTFTIGGGLATGGAVPVAIATQDLNEDGRSDFVLANLSTNSLSVFTGGCASTLSVAPTLTSPNGGEVWQPNTLRTITWTKSNVTAAVDLEVSRDGGANWGPIATGLGGTSFTWKVDFPPSDQARIRVRTHDYAHLQDASATDFTICPTQDTTLTSASVATQPIDVATGDVDGDGIADAIRATALGFAVARGLGTAGAGNGLFAPDTSYAALDTVVAIVARDVTLDGLADLVVARQRGFEVWHAQQGASGGTGRLARRETIDLGAATTVTGLLVLDADEDGQADLFLLRASGDVRRFAGAGGGFFSTTSTGWTVPSPVRATTNDFNGDGVADLAVASASAATPGVYVLLGIGAGGNGTGTFQTPVRYATASPALDVAAGQLDANATQDLAVLTAAGFSVLPGAGAGSGNGTFGSESVQSSFTGGRWLTLLDWNADGRLDVLAGFVSGPFAFGALRFHHGLGTGAAGDGGFARPDLLATLIQPLRPIPGDFRAGGSLDLLMGFVANDDTFVLPGGCESPAATLTLNAPNGGEALQIGSEATITWTPNALVSAVDLDLSLDSGVTWAPLATNVPGSSFAWTVTGSPTSHARIRVRNAPIGTPGDASDLDFVLFSDPVDAPGPALPRVVAFSAPRPNPSRGPVAFALDLPEAAMAQVELFDAAGRRVRTLLDGLRPAGTHRVAWDGRDDADRPLAPGVYLVRARAGSFEATRRIVRIP